MRITLGVSPDGQRAIRPSNRLGDIDVGPLGLLGLLETFLGLAAPVAPTAEWIIQYRDCLARSLTDHRFYTQAREHNPARWSGNTRNWSPVGAEALNPERDSIIKAHSENNVSARRTHLDARFRRGLPASDEEEARRFC